MEVLAPRPRRVPRPFWGGATPEKHLGTLIPSSATRRLNGNRWPVRARLGGGAAHVNPTRAIAIDVRAGADAQSTRRAQGQRPLGSVAFATQDRRHDRALSRGSSHGRPVRRWAQPRRAARLADTSAERTPCAVAACRTRHEPTSGRSRFRRCPGRVCSPGGREIAGPQRGSGGTRRRLRSRPPAGRRARSSCPRCQTACLPMPWPT
jgi:hypothetical protein